MVIAGIIELGIGFYIATSMAPSITIAAGEAGFAMPEGASQIASIADGFLWPPFTFMLMAGSLSWFGIAILGVLVLVLMFLFNRNPRPWELLAGAPEELLEPGAAD